MPVGFQAFAQDGSGLLQIDGLYRNLFFRRKGSATTASLTYQSQNSKVSSVTVNLGGGFNGRPLVFVNCSSPARGAGFATQNNDGSWSISVAVRGEVGSPFTWYAFDTLGQNDLSNYGLQVMNEQGTVIFDAAKRPMRVRGVMSQFATSGPPSSLTLPSGRTYAVCVAGGGRLQPTSGNTFTILGVGASVNGATTALNVYETATGSGGSIAQSHPSYALVVDVTNH